MPILTITVENPDELLNASYLDTGALIRVERSATGGGAGYSEIGTLAIVAGTRVYTYYDLAGAETSWYRTRYSKAGGTSPSGYGDEFQASPETGGLICALHDVEQRLDGTQSDDDRENLLELIRQVTVEVETYTGRDFTGDQLDVTFRVHTRPGRRLWLERGIQSVTSLGVASIDQPSSGGTYTATTDFYLDPPETDRDSGWPATSIVLLRTAAVSFADASFGAEVVGKRGFAAVPADVQRVGIELTINGWLAKGAASDNAVVGPSGIPVLLRDPRHRAVLDRYVIRRVA